MNSRLKKGILIISLVVLIVIIYILFTNRSDNSLINDDGVIVKENVSVLTKEIEDDTELIRINEDSIVFGENPKYKEGEILVAGILDSSSKGFIRRIVSVEKNDNVYVLKTENATLVDVFEEVHITKRFLLKKDLVEEVGFSGNEQANREMSYVQQLQASTELLEDNIKQVSSEEDAETKEQEYAFYEEFEIDISENTSISGACGVDAWLEVTLDIENNDVLFGMSAHSLVEGEVFTGVSYSDEIPFLEKELFSYKLPPLEFTAGPIPIVVTNEISADINVEAMLEGEVGIGCGLSLENSQGFQYDSKSNEIKKLSERDYLSDGIEVNTGASATVESMAGVILALDSRLYGSTGAVLGLGLAGEAVGELSVDMGVKTKYVGKLDMSIYPVVMGELIVTIPVIDYQLAEVTLFEEKLDPIWEKHWEEVGGTGENGDEIKYKNKQWGNVFSNVIEDMKIQEPAEYVSFITPYYADEVTELDGASFEGEYRTNGSKLYWCLKDINNEPDGVPELFIGTEVNGKKQIIAVYQARFGDIPCAALLSSISEMYGVYSMYLCQANVLFEGANMPGEKVTGGQFFVVTNEGRMNMGAYRAEDAERFIDSNTLEWKELNQW